MNWRPGLRITLRAFRIACLMRLTHPNEGKTTSTFSVFLPTCDSANVLNWGVPLTALRKLQGEAQGFVFVMDRDGAGYDRTFTARVFNRPGRLRIY